jgi:phage-related protein
MNHFLIDGEINSRSDLGLRIAEPPVLPATRRIAQNIEVDGREGSLTVLKGWEDITLTLTAAIVGKDIRARWRDVLPTLLAAQTLSLSNDSAVFYKVKRVEPGELSMRLTMLGEFALTFTCAPFRYMADAPTITLTSSGTVTNPGTAFSLPRMKVYGTGTRTLAVNGKPIVLNILSGHLVLDSDLLECHYGGVAQNNRMTGDFPVLEVGSNTVTLGSGITKVEIEPRWRYL